MKLKSTDEKEGAASRGTGVPTDQINLIGEESMLPTIAIGCKWLWGSNDVLVACGQSSQPLWEHFVELLNLLSVDLTAACKGNICYDINKFFGKKI